MGYGRDRGAQGYLAALLLRIKEFNDNKAELAALHAEGDGYCLVGACALFIVVAHICD